MIHKIACTRHLWWNGGGIYIAVIWVFYIKCFCANHCSPRLCPRQAVCQAILKPHCEKSRKEMAFIFSLLHQVVLLYISKAWFYCLRFTLPKRSTRSKLIHCAFKRLRRCWLLMWKLQCRKNNTNDFKTEKGVQHFWKHIFVLGMFFKVGRLENG